MYAANTFQRTFVSGLSHSKHMRERKVVDVAAVIATTTTIQAAVAKKPIHYALAAIYFDCGRMCVSRFEI